MTEIIYKYKLDVGDQTTLNLPEDAKILSAKAVDDDIYIWAIVHHMREFEKVIIKTKTTGYSFIEDNEDLEFIDTVIMNSGIVIHVFKENAWKA